MESCAFSNLTSALIEFEMPQNHAQIIHIQRVRSIRTFYVGGLDDDEDATEATDPEQRPHTRNEFRIPREFCIATKAAGAFGISPPEIHLSFEF